jgi:DNA-binding IclR family transcriptional regulator
MSSRNTVPALVKAIALIEAIASEPGHSSAQLARSCNVAAATCFRIIHTFQQARWIRQTGNGGWELAAGLMPLLRALRQDQSLCDLVRPHLVRLVAQTGISAKCSIRDGMNQVVILTHNANKPFTVNGGIDTSFPIVNGSSGAALLLDAIDLTSALAVCPDLEPQDSPRLLLQRQDDIRRQGWCSKIGVHPQGIDGISAPVRDAEAQVCCAITLLGLRGDMTPESLPALGKALRDCVAACQLAITAHQGNELLGMSHRELRENSTL